MRLGIVQVFCVEEKGFLEVVRVKPSSESSVMIGICSSFCAEDFEKTGAVEVFDDGAAGVFFNPDRDCEVLHHVQHGFFAGGVPVGSGISWHLRCLQTGGVGGSLRSFD